MGDIKKDINSMLWKVRLDNTIEYYKYRSKWRIIHDVHPSYEQLTVRLSIVVRVRTG